MWNIKALALRVQNLLARLKFSKIRSNFKVKITRSKVKVLSQEILMWNIKALFFYFWKYVKLQGQGNSVKNFWYPQISTHVKYQILTPSVQKVFISFRQNYSLTDGTKNKYAPISEGKKEIFFLIISR